MQSSIIASESIREARKMDKYVIVGLFAVAAVMFIVNIVMEIIKYYKRKKTLEELIRAALESDEENNHPQ